MNEVTVTQPHTTAIKMNSFDQLMRFAEMAATSGMVPSAYNGKPGAVLIAVQMGSELGLAPMQSLQNIAVINGRPSVWGDAMPALIKASPVCDDIIEAFEGSGENMVAICVAKRKGKAPVEARFSVEDAKAAGLWNKVGPWKNYPKRMLQMRARGFALRDAFPDVLRGLISAEEASDMPADNFQASVMQNQPQQKSIEGRRERPTDYVQLIQARLAKCQSTEDVKKVQGQWHVLLGKADDAGEPISNDVHDAVTEAMADCYRDLLDADKEQAERDAQVPANEVPA